MKRKKNTQLITSVVVTAALIAAFVIYSTCLQPAAQENEVELVAQVIKNPVKGYKKSPLRSVPELPEQTLSDDGFLLLTGEDSIEINTDLLPGYEYAIFIDSEGQTPFCQIYNEDGDSLEWNDVVQILQLQGDSIFDAKVWLNGVFRPSRPFLTSLEHPDSIAADELCHVIFAELANNKQDSLLSGDTCFPVLGCGTILRYQANEKVNGLYVKVEKKGIINVVIAYADDICGYPLFSNQEINSYLPSDSLMEDYIMEDELVYDDPNY